VAAASSAPPPLLTNPASCSGNGQSASLARFVVAEKRDAPSERSLEVGYFTVTRKNARARRACHVRAREEVILQGPGVHNQDCSYTWPGLEICRQAPITKPAIIQDRFSETLSCLLHSLMQTIHNGQAFPKTLLARWHWDPLEDFLTPRPTLRRRSRCKWANKMYLDGS
jgi:hypothetical protein